MAAALADARRLGVTTLFALTYERGYTEEMKPDLCCSCQKILFRNYCET